MTWKTRLLRIFGALLVLILFVGYFTFSTFLFDPFESGIGVDVSGLVDRKVDFFIARAHLSDTFEDFPHLAVEDEVVAHTAWESFSGSPEQEELLAALDYERLIGEVEQALSDLPMGLEPLDVFGGGDLALAGYLQGARLEDAQWALYGNLSTAGKLAIELLDYPGLLGLPEQGIEVTSADRHVTLTGPEFDQPIHLTRVRDVGILSNTPALLEAAHDFEARQFEDSFLLGATYHDKIQLTPRGADRDEMEVFLNTRKLLATMQVSGDWPDKNSQDFLPALGAKFFQLGFVNQVAGVLGLDEGATLDLHGEISTELLNPLQNRTYRRRAVSSDELLNEYAVYAPADASLFVYMKCDIGDLFEQFFASIEPAARELVEDVIPQTGKYRTLQQMIDDLDSALKDRCVLVMRPNTYEGDPNAAPHNDVPVPAIALVAWPKDKAGSSEKLDDIIQAIGGLGAQIGMAGKEPGQSGFYSYKVGGHKIHELWFPALDGTGHVSTLVYDKLCILSNHFEMPNHIFKTWTQGGDRGFPRLSERSDFSALVKSTQKGANFAVWFNPQTAATFFRDRARLEAMDSIEIDWSFQRNLHEDRILREAYGGRKRTELAPAEIPDFDGKVDAALEEVQRNITDAQLPVLMAEYERKIVYSEAMQGALLMLALKPEQFDLALRVMAPLGR